MGVIVFDRLREKLFSCDLFCFLPRCLPTDSPPKHPCRPPPSSQELFVYFVFIVFFLWAGSMASGKMVKGSKFADGLLVIDINANFKLFCRLEPSENKLAERLIHRQIVNVQEFDRSCACSHRGRQTCSWSDGFAFGWRLGQGGPGSVAATGPATQLLEWGSLASDVKKHAGKFHGVSASFRGYVQARI